MRNILFEKIFKNCTLLWVIQLVNTLCLTAKRQPFNRNVILGRWYNKSRNAICFVFWDQCALICSKYLFKPMSVFFKWLSVCLPWAEGFLVVKRWLLLVASWFHQRIFSIQNFCHHRQCHYSWPETRQEHWQIVDGQYMYRRRNLENVFIFFAENYFIWYDFLR